MERPTTKSLRQIHYYDGWVHYHSQVVDGAEFRVADVVRTVGEISVNTLQYLPDSISMDRLAALQVDRGRQWELANEAVVISLAMPTWLNNIMTGSPLRNNDIWRSEKRKEWRKDYEARRIAWKLTGKLLPLKILEC